MCEHALMHAGGLCAARGARAWGGAGHGVSTARITLRKGLWASSQPRVQQPAPLTGRRWGWGQSPLWHRLLVGGGGDRTH